MKICNLILSSLFLLSCGGGGGGGTQTPTPTSTPATPPQDTASITADPAVVFQGDSTVISWNSSNASSCTASSYWSGSKATSGSETVPMTGDSDQILTITCGTASSSVTVQVKTEDFEGSCVNPHNAEIYESYLGVYPMPSPQNVFGEDHIKAVGFKDYGVEWIYNTYKGKNASWIAYCTEDEYIKLMYRMTLRRLKEHGVNSVGIYNFGYWQDDQAEFWQIDQNLSYMENHLRGQTTSYFQKPDQE